ncbi:MAG: tRNA 4-thiouridine(8) synthase ThiI [Acidobacteria bacterium]|nr:tRNA 4-thiouridine(8) synthase ThiI [Acidobacteriota bacterium]MYE44111.1 tRNA 4-thiouridine(8) synthase ThiI [Acidobacteriota bacterium]
MPASSRTVTPAAVPERLPNAPAEAERPGGAAADPMREAPRRILIRSPEIRIKGRNRPSFREALKRNLGQRLRGIGLRWRASSAGDRVWIEVPREETAALDRALAAVATVFGVELALPCFVIPRPRGEAPSSERLLDDTTSLACGLAAAGRPETESGFALRVRRRDRHFPIRSQAIAESVGRAILERTAWERVDLSNPAFTIFIEPHEEAIYLWTRRVKGPGGLPVGVAGRLVGMLSGGFDSPVAAWMMAGRGAALDFVHLTPSRPDPASPTARKAADLVRILSRYTGRSRLVLVPYTHFDLRLTGSRTGHEALLFRRFAFRCGEVVARRWGAAALTTGDSLSQVASQTLENLISADAALSLPVLRPLVGLDKVAIMDRAQKIGTWETSAVPAKDCCALIAGSPRTRSEPERIAELEGRLFPDPGEVVRLSLREALVGVFQGGEEIEAFAPAADLFVPDSVDG